MTWAGVVLAAGQGTRMRSQVPKVLHEVAGRLLIDRVLDVAVARVPRERTVVVVGHGGERVREVVERRRIGWVVQEPQLGTGDALRVALGADHVRGAEAVIVLSGDVPLLRPATVAELQAKVEDGAAAAMLTAIIDEPAAYGRVVRGADGEVEAVVEAGDADRATLAVREVNAGVYAFRRTPVAEAIADLEPDNAQGEYYLTDVVGALHRRGRPVAAVVLDDITEMLGINTRKDLAEVAEIVNRRVLERLMARGVTIMDPTTTWVDDDCQVQADVVLEPGVVLRRGVRIASGARIGANSVLDGVEVEAGEQVPPLTDRRAPRPTPAAGDHGGYLRDDL